MKKMNDIMKIVESAEDSSLFIRAVCKTIDNEEKHQKG